MTTPATHVNTTTPMGISAGLPMPSANPINSPATSMPQDPTAIPASAQAAATPNGAANRISPGGSVTLDPNTTPSAALNPRSCVTCRRRKVRCDKFMPCGNCRKAHIQCVFPAPGRAPRRPRVRDPDAPPKQTSEREIELMKRLRKLEGIVEDLSGQIEFETSRHQSSSGGNSPEAATDGGAVSGGNTMERDRRRPAASAFGGNMPGGGSPSNTASIGKSTPPGDSTAGPHLRSATGEVQRELGRLVLNERGKTRYVSNALWTKLNDEINALRAESQKLTDEGSDGSEDDSSPSDTVYHSYADHGDHHGFVLGYKSSDVDLSKLHPLPSQIPFIWQVYVENVDPLVKVLHVPTMNQIIRDCRNSMNNLSPGLEALMFSIYLASITSMEEDEVKLNFGVEKATLVNRHRFATEQALAKANFLTTSELVVVQAFTLFLVLVRRYDNTRFSWTLTGLAIRIAKSLGLHREGTHFAELKPFDVEMRRRLWWTLCLLDLRSAEDQGTELTITEGDDTRLPLNVNDCDLSPDMTDYPEERQSITDMSFSLVRFEVCVLARKMHTAASTMSPIPRSLHFTAQEREDWLVEAYDRIEEKYLKGTITKDSNPLHWVASIIARLIMAKLSLIIYQPAVLEGDGPELSQKIRDRLFLSCVEVVEYTKILDAEQRCRQWRWLFQTYSQWHAVAYLLLEICRRPWTSSVERGWMALKTAFSEPDPVLERAKSIEHSAVWIPLRKLMLKAERHREAEITRLRNDPREAERLDVEEMNKAAPASFQHLPSSVRNTLAQERWRALVGREHLNKPKQPCWGDTNFGRPGTIGARPSEQQGQQQQPRQPPHQLQQQITKAQLEQMDRAMDEPTLNPVDIWSAAFQSGVAETPSSEIAQTAFFGAGPFGAGPAAAPFRTQSEQAQQQQSGAGAGADTFTPTADSSNGATAAQCTPADVGAVLDDHLPPWLWPPSTSNEWYASTPDSGNAAAAKAPVLDDADVNMDEEININWENWQESIRGFEMDTGMGLRRTPFMGGCL
ncbi:hypothetical protein DL769_001505 [Monosporascus sp. CRB-8-3]|nr:hypothetical protein DL769_001505 [Monosporascus sp. CRB-8-3]